MATDNLPGVLYTAAGLRALDQLVIEEFGVSGLTLMRRAAGACVRAISCKWPGVRKVTVYCGSGNNAGDGYILAGMLAERGCEVTVQVVGDPGKLGADGAEAYRYCQGTRATLQSFSPAADAIGFSDLVVDALLGTGISGTVRPEYGAAIEAINGQSSPVLAVDIPSGLCADTGAILGHGVKATLTVTFIGLKCGLFTLEGPDHVGELIYDDLDVPPAVFDKVSAGVTRLTLADSLRYLPVRPRNAHKNQFGHVLVVGGDEAMGGAVAMSAEAALRSGAGLVSVATHPVHAAALLSRRPELMVKGFTDSAELLPLLARASVVVLGPGLGRSRWSTAVFRKVLEAVDTGEQQMVVDADGLNLLAMSPEKRSNWVLTPHPGEASNLLQDNRIQANRFRSVATLQSRYGGTVLLKGAGTLVYDGHTLALCPFGNPGMSSAGMGDVLSGVIGGLLAQGLPAGEATRLGVLVHALAGDRCAAGAGERGMAATDLLAPIRSLLNPAA
ncbi:MAG: NAD(P)H-hydrate dehydratase [Pseudomonadales bacterium]